MTDAWGAGPLSLATGLTYRDQSFRDEAFPASVDDVGPPLNAPELGIQGYEGQTSSGGAWRVSLNVQNLFDKDPPIIAASADSPFGAQATDNTSDVWGRRYQLGVNFAF